jgi:hypothetical protein
MNKGKTIQIFLPDGNPQSIRIGEITRGTIQCLSIPRSNLEFGFKRPELKNVGIYFLVGTSDEGESQLYIGEAESCLKRIKQHNLSKDFWNIVLAVVSKTQFFTKSHIKYLEWLCHKDALETNRFLLENSANPTKPHISESLEADLLKDFEEIKLLVSALGFPFFDSIIKPMKKNLLFCKGKDAKAEGKFIEEGLVVFSGSTCNVKLANSSQGWLKKIRNQLIDSGILALENNVYKFTSDYIFSSPSAAAATVLARSSNGWNEWKSEDGKTLHELYRKK